MICIVTNFWISWKKIDVCYLAKKKCSKFENITTTLKKKLLESIKNSKQHDSEVRKTDWLKKQNEITTQHEKSAKRKRNSVVASNVQKNRTKRKFCIDTIDNDHAILELDLNASLLMKKNGTKKMEQKKVEQKEIEKKKNNETKRKSKSEKKTLHRVRFRKPNSWQLICDLKF